MAVKAAVSTIEHQHPFLSWLNEMVRMLYFVSFHSQLVHKSVSAVFVPHFTLPDTCHPSDLSAQLLKRALSDLPLLKQVPEIEDQREL